MSIQIFMCLIKPDEFVDPDLSSSATSRVTFVLVSEVFQQILDGTEMSALELLMKSLVYDQIL